MTLSPIEEVVADVCVIGAGGAGLRAAYEAAAMGAETVLVTKGRPTQTGTTAFGVASTAGFAAADGKKDPEDNPDVHYGDIMERAQGCADPRVVRVLVDEAMSAYHDLRDWGADFMRDPNTGESLIALGDFASRPRNRKLYHHGRSITVVLAKRIEPVGVRVLDHTMVLELLFDDTGVYGALALTADGRPVMLRSGVTVLTTGGAGTLFKYSLLPPDVTGDGYALGYRAGAALANLEFMQAGFGTLKPALNAVQPWFWRLLPRFVDKNGNPVLDPMLPTGLTPEQVMNAKAAHYPFSTSDLSMWLEISAKTAMLEGRATEDGGFELDLRGVDEAVLPEASDLQTMWQVSKQWLRNKNMDVEREPLSVGLFGHAINGGMTISVDGETSVPGLLAAGEATTGPYGADRLGGNMLLNCQVFGKRAGRRAADIGRSRMARARTADARNCVAEVEKRIASREPGRDLAEAVATIQETMTHNLLIVRTEAGLAAAQHTLGELEGALDTGAFRPSAVRDILRLHEALNMAQVGLLMAGAARLRKESRGSHYRHDFPGKDRAWEKPVIVTKGPQGPKWQPGHFS